MKKTPLDELRKMTIGGRPGKKLLAKIDAFAKKHGISEKEVKKVLRSATEARVEELMDLHRKLKGKKNR